MTHEFIVNAGSNTDYGARLYVVPSKVLEDPLSEELLKGEFSGKNKIVVDAKWDSDHERIERLDFQVNLQQPRNGKKKLSIPRRVTDPEVNWIIVKIRILLLSSPLNVPKSLTGSVFNACTSTVRSCEMIPWHPFRIILKR